MLKRILLGFTLCTVFTGGAHAQFVGDVFFKEPSIPVPSGGTGLLEVVTFAGNTVLGAAQLDITYNATQLEIVATRPGLSAEFEKAFVDRAQPGRVSLIAMNDTSLAGPIGTVSLAMLEVRALGTPGTRAPLTIAVRGLLNQASSPFAASRGFAGEVVVTSPALFSVAAPSSARSSAVSAPTEDASIPGAPTGEQRERVLSFRRPGQVVDIVEPVQTSTGVRNLILSVKVPDEGAESESALVP